MQNEIPHLGRSVLRCLGCRCWDVCTYMGSLRKGFILMISVLGTFFPFFFPPSHLSFFPPITQDTVTEVWWSFVLSYSLISILLCMRHCVRCRGDALVTQPWSPPSWGSVPLEKYRGAKLCGDWDHLGAGGAERGPHLTAHHRSPAVNHNVCSVNVLGI